MNKFPTIEISPDAYAVRIQAADYKTGYMLHITEGREAFFNWLKNSEDSPFNRLPEAIKLADVLTADIQFLEDKVADLEEKLLRAQAMLGRVVLGAIEASDGGED